MLVSFGMSDKEDSWTQNADAKVAATAAGKPGPSLRLDLMIEGSAQDTGLLPMSPIEVPRSLLPQKGVRRSREFDSAWKESNL